MSCADCRQLVQRLSEGLRLMASLLDDQSDDMDQNEAPPEQGEPASAVAAAARDAADALGRVEAMPAPAVALAPPIEPLTEPRQIRISLATDHVDFLASLSSEDRKSAIGMGIRAFQTEKAAEAARPPAAEGLQAAE